MPDVPIEAKGIRMYPPTMESNDSPSYPGLKSTYYLHRFDVRVSGIPQEAFRTVKRIKNKTQIFLWEWVESESVKLMGVNANIVEYYINNDKRVSGLARVVEYFHKNIRKSRVHVLSMGQLVDKVDDVIMNMLKKQLETAAKSNEHQTLKAIIKEIRKAKR